MPLKGVPYIRNYFLGPAYYIKNELRKPIFPNILAIIKQKCKIKPNTHKLTALSVKTQHNTKVTRYPPASPDSDFRIRHLKSGSKI